MVHPAITIKELPLKRALSLPSHFYRAFDLMSLSLSFNFSYSQRVSLSTIEYITRLDVISPCFPPLTNVLGEKLLPLVQRPPRTRILNNAIKNHSRSNVDAYQAIHLGDDLQVIGHGIALVQRSVFSNFLRNGQQLVDLILTDANLCGDLGQATVSLVPSLVDDTDVVEFGLHCE